MEICNCSHGRARGLVVVTVGNSVRGDDGAASTLCDRLPSEVMHGVCRVDLGIHTGLISESIGDHKAVIIIDAMNSGIDPGTAMVIDLSNRSKYSHDVCHMNLRSTHGLSIIDELSIARQSKRLPETIVFFGIEVDSAGWNANITTTLESHLPQLIAQLSALINSMK